MDRGTSLSVYNTRCGKYGVIYCVVIRRNTVVCAYVGGLEAGWDFLWPKRSDGRGCFLDEGELLVQGTPRHCRCVAVTADILRYPGQK